MDSAIDPAGSDPLIRLDLTKMAGIQPDLGGSGIIIFFENDFVENILRQKSFYVETNGNRQIPGGGLV
jgi:hypothetical protein